MTETITIGALELENIQKVAPHTHQASELETLPGDVSLLIAGNRTKLQTITVLIALFVGP